MPLEHEYVIVTGCSRSGTSILAEVLAQHPDVEHIWEPKDAWIGCAASPGLDYRYTEANIGPGTQQCVLTVLDKHSKTDKPVRLVKDPRLALMGRWLLGILPEVKVICIVRNGYDNVCSLRPGIKKGWNHEKIPGWWLYNADADLTLEQKCAVHWSTVNGAMLADLGKEGRACWVYYERLVKTPQESIAMICEWLGWQAHEDVLSYAGRITDDVAGSYQPEFQKKMWFVDDHSVRIGRWQENLTESQLGLIAPIIGPLMVAFGYWQGLTF